jgi:hypothetical protein
MTFALIKEKLHEYIENADEKKVQAIYTLVENEIEHTYSYSPEELNMLHERAGKYLKGEGTTYTVEESHNKIRQQRKA